MGMLALVPTGTYDHTYTSIDDLETTNETFSVITSTAVIGTHVGSETVFELATKHLELSHDVPLEPLLLCFESLLTIMEALTEGDEGPLLVQAREIRQKPSGSVENTLW